MPKMMLSQGAMAALRCPPEQAKVDIFDLGCKGLMLEIRKSGTATWYFRYSDRRANQRQYRLGGADTLSLKAARARIDELRAELSLGRDPQEQRQVQRAAPTFAEFIAERYLPFIQGYKRSWRSDDSYLRNHLLPALGSKYLDAISRQDVVRFHHGMRAAGYALGTCNRCLVLLKYAFNLALRWEIAGLASNPAKDCALFEDLDKKERFLTPAETERLYEAVRRSDNAMLQYIVPALILTGARKREVLSARWQDFDFTRKQWRIPITKLGRTRHVPISDALERLLHSVPRTEGGAYVFANPQTGRPYVSVFCAWDTARKLADLADVRMHDLRHSFASFLVNAGRSLYEVQKLLGHTQVKTTQRYAHLSQETLLDAANAANASMGAGFLGAVGAAPPA